MPHIIVKWYPEGSQTPKKEPARAVTRDAAIAGCPETAISVALEEVSPEAWAETVYRPDILEKEDTLIRKPGYYLLSMTSDIAGIHATYKHLSKKSNLRSATISKLLSFEDFSVPPLSRGRASGLRTIRTRRLSEPRHQRGEFRRVRPQPRRAGVPEGLVTRAFSFGSVFFHVKENEQLNTT